MIGLIKKDFYTLKGNIKALGIIFVVFIGLACLGEMDLSMMAPFLAVSLFISTFSYDEFNHFDIYGVTFPSGRKDVVKAKYITGVIMASISIFFAFLINLAASLSSEAGIDIETMFACILSSLIVIFIVIPMMFKFGAEKGRIAIFVLVYGIIFAIFVIANWHVVKIPNDFIEFLNKNWIFLSLSISLILLVVSYFISTYFYKKREY